MGLLRFRKLLPTAVAVIVMAFYLFRVPVAGIADNGDFWRVMVPAGIEYRGKLPERYRELARTYTLSDSRIFDSTTSAAIPAFTAAKASSIFSESFDLRTLGLLNLCLFASGLAMLTLSFGGWPFAFGLAWIGVEPTYFLHFNSFYSQSFSLALFPWLLWSLVRTCETARRNHAVILAATSFFIATSKLQLALIPLLSLAVICLYARRKVLFPASLLLMAAFLTFFLSFLPNSRDNSSLAAMNRYHAAFTGILPVASNSSQAMSALGIPEQYSFLNGIGFENTPVNVKKDAQLAMVLHSLTVSRLAWVYFTTPGALVHSLPLFAAGLQRTPLLYLGNFENTLGSTLDFPWQISRARDGLFRLLPFLPWFVSVALLLFFALEKIKKAPAKPWQVLVAFLLLNFLTQLPIIVVGNGFFALHRLLIPARLSLDIVILILLDLAIITAWAKISRRG